MQLDLLLHHDLVLYKVVDDLAMLLLALESHVLLDGKGEKQSLHYRLLLFIHFTFLKPQFDVSKVSLRQSNVTVASFDAALRRPLLPLDLFRDNLHFLQELLDAVG